MGHERPILVFLLQEHFLQIVQEAPAQGGRLQAGGSASSRPRLAAASNWCAMTASDRPVRFAEQGRRHAVLQAQGVQHELEGQLVRPDLSAFGQMAAAEARRRPASRIPGCAGAPRARCDHGKTACPRARTDAQVVAEFPVIQVMTATRARPGVGGHLVARLRPPWPARFRPGPAWRRWYRRPANPGRELGEHRVRLHRQVIERQMPVPKAAPGADRPGRPPASGPARRTSDSG